MTPQQPKSSAHAHPSLLALMGTALLGALYLTLQARGMTAQEVFGVDMDFDDV